MLEKVARRHPDGGNTGPAVNRRQNLRDMNSTRNSRKAAANRHRATGTEKAYNRVANKNLGEIPGRIGTTMSEGTARKSSTLSSAKKAGRTNNAINKIKGAYGKTVGGIRSAGSWVGSGARSTGSWMKAHPVKAGLIGAGTAGAGAGIYALNRHLKNKKQNQG